MWCHLQLVLTLQRLKGLLAGVISLLSYEDRQLPITCCLIALCCMLWNMLRSNLTWLMVSCFSLCHFFCRTQINFTVAIDFTASNGECFKALLLLMKPFKCIRQIQVWQLMMKHRIWSLSYQSAQLNDTSPVSCPSKDNDDKVGSGFFFTLSVVLNFLLKVC